MTAKKLNKEQRSIVARGKSALRARAAKARIQETVAQKVGLVASAAALGYVDDDYDVLPGIGEQKVPAALAPTLIGYGVSLLMPAGNIAAAMEGVGDAGVALLTHNMVRKRGQTPPAVSGASVEDIERRAFQAGVDSTVRILAERERAAG